MRTLAALIPVLAAAACGDGAPSTPEAVVRRMVTAIDRGDAREMVRLTVPPPRLLKALTCDQHPSIVDKIGVRTSFLEQRPDVLAGVTAKFESVTVDPVQHVAAGARFHDCTTTEAFDTATYKLKATVTGTTDGKSRDDGELIRLDGRWYSM